MEQANSCGAAEAIQKKVRTDPKELIMKVVFVISPVVFIAAVLTQFVGASLLAEGILDLISFLTINKRIKEFRKAMEKASSRM